jgi:acyl-CoA thioesterase I
MKKPTNIYFFGDSTCFGQHVSPHETWVHMCSAELSKLAQSSGSQVVCQNPSINGNTTRQALERMPYDIQSHHPEILVIQLGMNDCNCWATDQGNARVSPKAFEANLSEIVTRGFTFGAQRVILHTNHPSARDQEKMANASCTYQENNQRYNEIIRSVSRQRVEILLNDIEAAFLAETKGDREVLVKLLMPDLLHLNSKGHRLYFDKAFPVLKAALQSIL